MSFGYKREKENENRKDAALKAMELLNYRARSEAELRKKLLEKEYSEEDVEKAIAYVKSFGYINDRSYAQAYVSEKAAQKSTSMMRMELREKGIEDSLIEEALEQIEEEEEDIILCLLQGKSGEPHELDEKEYRRLYGFCARRGFSSGKIYKALKRYVEEAKN